MLQIQFSSWTQNAAFSASDQVTEKSYDWAVNVASLLSYFLPILQMAYEIVRMTQITIIQKFVQ